MGHLALQPTNWQATRLVVQGAIAYDAIWSDVIVLLSPVEIGSENGNKYELK